MDLLLEQEVQVRRCFDVVCLCTMIKEEASALLLISLMLAAGFVALCIFGGKTLARLHAKKAVERQRIAERRSWEVAVATAAAKAEKDDAEVARILPEYRQGHAYELFDMEY